MRAGDALGLHFGRWPGRKEWCRDEGDSVEQLDRGKAGFRHSIAGMPAICFHDASLNSAALPELMLINIK